MISSVFSRGYKQSMDSNYSAGFYFGRDGGARPKTLQWLLEYGNEMALSNIGVIVNTFEEVD